MRGYFWYRALTLLNSVAPARDSLHVNVSCKSQGASERASLNAALQ